MAVDTPNQAIVAVDTTEYTDTNDTTDTIDITDTYDITDTCNTIVSRPGTCAPTQRNYISSCRLGYTNDPGGV